MATATVLALAAARPGSGQEVASPEGDLGDPAFLGVQIEPGLWRIDGIEPGIPTQDLEPLRARIGKASVVALGESSHTSGGYYTAKHRVFRYLVERAGFRALAIESPWAGADRVGTYLRTCKGSIDDALQGLQPEWHSAEIRTLVEWMCAWNRTHRAKKDKLTFVGFDIRQPEVDGPALIAFLKKIGIGAGDPRVAGILRCDGAGGERADPGNVSPEDHAACVEALDAIGEKFAREGKAIAKKTGKVAFEWAKVALAGLRAWQDHSFYLGTDWARSDEARDAGMAATLRSMQSLRLGKKTRVVTWAHNFHVSRAPMPDPNGPFRTMGTSLGETLGAGYFVVGLIGWEVDVDLGGTCPGLPSPTAQSMEGRLHGLGESYLLVDTRTSSSVFDASLPIEVSAVDGVAAAHYDALLFLDHSPPMIPLFRPPC